jgi:hypothetical protein
MKKQVREAVSRLAAVRKKVTIERVARVYAVACVGIYAGLIAADPAAAQSLRATGETIFNTLYSCVGVFGGIACLVSAINWKGGNFLGTRDPKATFMHSVLGTALGFGAVGIIQFIKGAVGSTSGISGV